MMLDSVEKLQVYLTGLEGTLTRRNKRIAQLEGELEHPEPVGDVLQKLLDKEYRKGWNACANRMTVIVTEAALSLQEIRKGAFGLFLSGDSSKKDLK